jgi:hypothetical protein
MDLCYETDWQGKAKQNFINSHIHLYMEDTQEISNSQKSGSEFQLIVSLTKNCTFLD